MGILQARILEWVAMPSSMHDTGCLGLVHWDDPEGWNGEGGGRRVQDGCPTLCDPIDGSPLGSSGKGLSWRIPGMGEAGGLPSMGSHRVGHN